MLRCVIAEARRGAARRRDHRRLAPHTEIGRLAACPASTTPRTSRSTAWVRRILRARAAAGDRARPASVCCVRSLVPMLKKSAWRARRSAMQRRRRHLDHDARGHGPAVRRARRRERLVRALQRGAHGAHLRGGRDHRISTRMSAAAPARPRIARSCASSSAGRARERRTPRTPRLGFASARDRDTAAPCRRRRRAFGPRSERRRTRRRSPRAAPLCSSSPGSFTRSRNSISVRRSPDPEGAGLARARASEGRPRSPRARSRGRRRGATGRPGRLAAAVTRGAPPAAARARSWSRIRVEPHLAGRAVEAGARAAHVGHQRRGPGDRGDAGAPQQDGGVRGGTAAPVDDAEHPPRFEPRRLRRREVLGHDDGRRPFGQHRRGAAEQGAHHGVAHVVDVGLARLQVRVVELPVDRGRRVDRLAGRPRRRCSAPARCARSPRRRAPGRRAALDARRGCRCRAARCRGPAPRRSSARRSRSASATGSSTVVSGTSGTDRTRRTIGPSAMPGATGIAWHDAGGAACAAAGASRCRSAASASTASPACRPVARKRSTSPRRAPREASAIRLEAGTGPRAAVTFSRVIAASKAAARVMSRAAGRAWRPLGSAIASSTVAAGEVASVAAPAAAAGRSASPRCSAFGASACRASAAT